MKTGPEAPWEVFPEESAFCRPRPEQAGRTRPREHGCPSLRARTETTRVKHLVRPGPSEEQFGRNSHRPSPKTREVWRQLSPAAPSVTGTLTGRGPLELSTRARRDRKVRKRRMSLQEKKEGKCAGLRTDAGGLRQPCGGLAQPPTRAWKDLSDQTPDSRERSRAAGRGHLPIPEAEPTDSQWEDTKDPPRRRKATRAKLRPT